MTKGPWIKRYRWTILGGAVIGCGIVGASFFLVHRYPYPMPGGSYDQAPEAWARYYWHKLKNHPSGNGIYGDNTPGEQELVGLKTLGPRARVVVPEMLDEILADTRWSDDLARIFVAIGPVTPEVVPKLAQALEKTGVSTAQNVARTLGEMGPAAAGAADALTRVVKNGPERLRREAAIALVKIGVRSREAVPILQADIENQLILSENREHAVGLLGQIGPNASAALPDLRRLAGAGPPTSSMQVFCTLSVLRIEGKPDAALAAAIRLLGASDDIAWSTVHALAYFGPEAAGALPALAETFRRPGASSNLRIAITETFKALKFNTPLVMDTLTSGLKDPNEYVRNHCDWAIRKLNGLP